MIVKNQGSYRQIMKATSIFGGVQVFTIVISLIKSKFVAIWLGASGMGVWGLLNAPIAIITTVSGLGLAISATQKIAKANGSDNEDQISSTITTFKRWVWFSGFLGMFLTLILAPWLSKWTFGNDNYILAFSILSLSLLFNNLSAGQKVLLQGMRKIKYMANANIFGAIVGLLFSLPLYYFFGNKGIVPAIIITSLVALYLSWYYSKKIKIKPIDISLRNSFFHGLEMVKLGLVMAFSGFIGTLIRYVIIAYINRNGSIEEVGFYNVGNNLITGYVGMIFAAMATDYFPRISGTLDNKEFINQVNYQIEISLLILTPLCILLMIFLPFFVQLLYSKEFLAVIPMIEWLLIATIIKSISWSMGFMFLAKANFTTAFIIDNVINIFLLVGYIGMYSFLGLEGIGIGEVILFCLAIVITYYLSNKKYLFHFTKQIKILSIKSIICISTIFILLRIFDRTVLTISIILIVYSVILVHYLYEIDKRLNIKPLLKTFLSKYNDKSRS